MRKALFGILFLIVFTSVLASISYAASTPFVGDTYAHVDFDAAGNVYVVSINNEVVPHCLNLTKYDSSFNILQTEHYLCQNDDFSNVRIKANSDRDEFYVSAGVFLTGNTFVEGDYWHLTKFSTDISVPPATLFSYDPHSFTDSYGGTSIVDPNPHHLYSGSDVYSLAVDNTDHLYTFSLIDDDQTQGYFLQGSHLNRFTSNFVSEPADFNCYGALGFYARDMLASFGATYEAADGNDCFSSAFQSAYCSGYECDSFDFFNNFLIGGWAKSYYGNPLGVFVDSNNDVLVVEGGASIGIAKYDSSGNDIGGGFSTMSFGTQGDIYSVVLGSDDKIYFVATELSSTGIFIYQYDPVTKDFTDTGVWTGESLLIAGEENIYALYDNPQQSLYVQEFIIETQSEGFHYSTGIPSQSIAKTDAVVDSINGLYMYIVSEDKHATPDKYALSLQLTCYQDLDGDGFGNPAVSQIVYGNCDPGYITDNTDCDDGEPGAYPGAVETLAMCGDGIDQDCVGGDLPCGFESSAVACSNSIDDDSDGLIDCADPDCASFCAPVCLGGYVDCYLDADNDWYYDVVGPTSICIDDGTCSEQLVGSGWTDIINSTSCPYVGAAGTAAPGVAGTCIDCNDNNPTLGYLCCDPGKHFVYWKTQTFVLSSEINPNDFGWNESSYYPDIVDNSSYVGHFETPSANIRENKFLGACCDNVDDCVLSTDPGNSGGCFPSGSPLANILNSGKVKCSTNSLAPNAWLDCDASLAVCEASGCGGTWAVAGINGSYIVNVSGTTYVASLDSPFGENNVNTHSECCGDEIDETIITTSCDGSTLVDGICCPDNTYVALNGNTCVKREDCPDKMRGAPVWVNAPVAASRVIWDAHLQSSGDGYCCELTDINHPPAKPLCDGVIGCFVKEKSMPLSQSEITLCDNTLSDDYCVIEACAGDFSICQEIEICNSEIVEISYDSFSNPVLVTSYTTTEESESYPTWSEIPPSPSSNPVNPITASVTEEDPGGEIGSSPGPIVGCDPAGRCEERIVDVCEKEDCYAFCEKDGNSFDPCEEVCDYTCEEFTTYFGTDCYVDCYITGEKIVENIISVDVDKSEGGYTELDCIKDFGCTNDGNFVPFGNELVIIGSITAYAALDPILPSVLPVSYETLETYCNTELACADYPCVGGDPNAEINKGCLRAVDDFGEEVFVRDDVTGDLMQCRNDGLDFPSTDIFTGDPWCPQGFEYSGNFYCEPEELSCDIGFAGNLLNGCDSLFNPQNDTIWNQYHDGCFFQYIPTNTFDRSCCLTTEIATFQLYEESNVRVY